MSEQQPQASTGTGRLVAKLVLTVVGMFGFGFAMVPLYDVFCEWTGLNGKTGGRVAYEVASAEVDVARTVVVQFAATNNGAMSWEFRPMQNQIEVHPGELNEVRFFARNPSDARVVGQAVPSVSPSEGADFLHKTECFCFTQQVLEAGESIEMPVRFFVDQALPKDVHKLTLSYTLFDVTANFENAATVSSAE